MGSRTKMRLSVILLFALIGLAAAFPQAGDGKENAVAQEKDEDSPKETVFVDDGQDDTDKDGESSDGATAVFSQAGDDKENTVSQEEDEKSRQEITPTAPDRQEQERELHAEFFSDKSSHDLEIDIHDLPFRQGECEPSNDALQRQKCLEWNFCHPKLYPCKWPKSKLCKHCMKGNSQLPKKFPRCEPCRCKKTVENYASHKNYLNTYLTKIILTTDFKIGTAYCAGEDNATTPDDSFVALVQRTHDAYLDTWDED